MGDVYSVDKCAELVEVPKPRGTYDPRKGELRHERDYYRELAGAYADMAASRVNSPGQFSSAAQRVEDIQRSKPTEYESERRELISVIRTALDLVGTALRKLEAL